MNSYRVEACWRLGHWDALESYAKLVSINFYRIVVFLLLWIILVWNVGSSVLIFDLSNLVYYSIYIIVILLSWL